jgi:acyl-CoA reductase-like NAD-dependent aldehyde dehydrogenase
MSTFHLTIDGKPVKSAQYVDVINPADETVAGSCPVATLQDLDAAVAAARKAFGPWSALTPEARAAKLMQVADVLEKNQAELARLVTLEQGKTQSGPGAMFEAGGAVAWTRVTASLNLPDEVINQDESGRITLRRKPVGVVGSITPWNWPLMIAVWHVMPALRVGCTVVIKPSPFTPLSTLKLVELMNTVLPPGVINVVTGDAEIGSRMSTHHGINKMVFTGSIASGKKVLAGAIDTLKRVTLELGGNDAGILLPGTNVAPLLEPLFWGCFINAGQTCAALKRLYVHESQYDEVVKQLAEYVAKIPVGNGMDPANLIGPISTRPQFEKVAKFVDDARARGARVVTGGVKPKGPGYFYPLTILADVSDDMAVVKDEQFGPVIPVIKYKTVDEAIKRANALDYGLGGSVWGNDPAEATRYANQLECGTVWVNKHGMLHPLAPFGGTKCSGIGTEFNVDGLKEYTTVNVLHGPA